MITIKQCAVSEMQASPNFAEMLREYADELALEGLQHPEPKLETYHKLEAIGILHPIAAFDDDKIVGLINVLMPENPHHGGRVIAVTESYFVCKDNRKSGAGLMLLSAAKKLAKELGSPALFVSAKADSNLSQALPNLGFTKTNEVFYACLN